MTAETSESSPAPDDSRALLRLETRLAQAEAQIRALQDAMGEVHDLSRMQKQRALSVRLILLLLALGALFFMKMRGNLG